MKQLSTIVITATLVLLIPLLIGCTLAPEEPTPTATSVVEPSPTEPTAGATVTATEAATAEVATSTAIPVAATATTTPVPATATTMPDATAEPGGQALVPAALYYLNNGQILRMEADSLTVTAIANEAEPVTGFDVHPGSNLLVYVSGNDLIQTDGSGANRQVLVEGEDFAEDNYVARITQEIRNPRIAPDGTQIAFGLNGVNVIDAGDSSGNYTVLQPSDPYPETPEEMQAEGPTRFFWPSSWAPDGSKVLVEFAYFPEAGGLAIYDLSTGTLVDITNPDGIADGDWTWGTGSETAFIANNLIVYGAPGLARVDASNGSSVTLIQGLPSGEVNEENPIRTFRAPHQTVTGDLLTFAQVATDIAFVGGPAGYQIYQVNADSTLAPLRPEGFAIGDVLWADNDLGAVFVDVSNDQNYPYSGPMRWVPLDGAPVLDLPANGSSPRWGGALSTPGDSGLSDAARADLVEQFKATLDLQAEGGIQDVAVRSLVTSAGDLWLVHTVGTRSFDPLQPHVVAAYRYTGDGWQAAGRMEFAEGGDPQLPPGPDYLNEGSVRQVFVEPTHTWVMVNGGVGAHAGTFHLLRHDGLSFAIAAANGNSSPGAGRVEDLNGDGLQEVILDLTNPYVFYYVSGVRLVDYAVERWNGEVLEPVELICCQADDLAWTLNDEAVALAEGELWQDARELIAEAQVEAPQDDTIAWNGTLIDLIAGERERAISPYPLLGNVFFGAYERAVDTMRGYPLAEVFSANPPFVAGTVADGSMEYLVEYLLAFSEKALAVKPELAPAHFIRGWALYQSDRADPKALESVGQAQTLAPDDPLYSQSVGYLSP